MLNYKALLADPDVWIRKGINDRGVKYYEMLLLYVDDCLAIGSQPMNQLEEINKYFPMKRESMGPPKIYLGAKVGKTELPNGVKAFYFSMSQYV